MPATEQTWRDQKLMHRIFAVSSAVLLGSTVWMFLADHWREWKGYQRDFRQIELLMNNWQKIQFETDRAEAEHASLYAELLTAKSAAIDGALLDSFKAEVNREAKSRELDVYDFGGIDDLAKQLSEESAVAAESRSKAGALRAQANLAAVDSAQAGIAAKTAQEAISAATDRALAQADSTSKNEKSTALTQAAAEALAAAQDAEQQATDAEATAAATRDRLVEKLQSIVEAARFREELVQRYRKSKSAAVDAAKGALGIVARDAEAGNKDDEARLGKLQAEIDELVENEVGGLKKFGLNKLTEMEEDAAGHRKDLQRIIDQMTAGTSAVEKSIKENEADLVRLKAAHVERRSTYFVGSFPFLGKKWLELPILDAFNSPLTIDNKWDNDNTIDYNFSRVRRFDRCTTCHQAMERTMPGSAVDPAYVSERELNFILQSPEKSPTPEDGDGPLPTLMQVYGIQLAEQGDYLIGRDDATVSFVQPYSSDRQAHPAKVDIKSDSIPAEGEIRLRLRTDVGQDEISFSGSQSPAEIVEALGKIAEKAGIVATDVKTGDGKSLIRLRSSTLGSAAFVSVEIVKPGSDESALLLVGQGEDAVSSLGAQAAIVTGEPQEVEGYELRKSLMKAATDIEGDTSQPGLMAGDVIVEVDGDRVRNRGDAIRLLLTGRTDWGEPVRLVVRRGLPDPYVTHPRLDLFVGSLSPHKVADFACTMCHEGQGSATAFKWASHTPNTPSQRKDWRHDNGWFDNHHWIFPMYPTRHAESSCLKCHHDVTELEPSQRFAEAPAPKVTRGHNLIRKYGCFGCHEVNGYDGDERVGPDLRPEPNYFAAAQDLRAQIAVQLTKAEAGFAPIRTELLPIEKRRTPLAGEKASLEAKKAELSADSQNIPQDQIQQIDARIAEIDKQLAVIQEEIAPVLARARPFQTRIGSLEELDALSQDLVAQPANNEVRHRLLQLLAADARLDASALPDGSNGVEELLADVETPGTLRRSGPSLRYVSHKLDEPFLYDWIRNPKHFRESTRMPRFFGLWQHLHGESRELAERYEPIEILAITTFLLERSQPFEYAQPPEGISESTPEERVERGRVEFERCLTCHNHKAFEDAVPFRDPTEIVQGPDLSGVAAKFGGEKGRNWLYGWIRNPSNYHARTVMPNMLLDPVQQKDATGNVTAVTDPVADIVEFLLAESTSDWKPADGTLSAESLSEDSLATIDELVTKNLAESFPRDAENYRDEGIPETLRGELKGAEIEMVGGNVDTTKKLLYLGRKSIGKYGCYGCHDIPGFEAAKPIGTGLADWGRKDPSKLAFNHIVNFLHDKKHSSHGHGTHFQDEGEAHGDDHGHEADHAEEDREGMFDEQDKGFYLDALNMGHRAGFIFQKLVEPRSYDYHEVDNKGYNERLRMPRFPFNDVEREAVATFVLGLVADPPANKFIYQPDERQRAIIEGRQVLQKYNCGGCHMLEFEKWDIEFSPGDGYFGSPPATTTFPFMVEKFTPEQLLDSAVPNRQGKLQARLVGLPGLTNEDGLPAMEDDAGDELFEGDVYDPQNVDLYFEIFEPLALNGKARQVGTQSLRVRADMIRKRFPTDGGFLPKYMLPRALRREKQVNPGAKGKEAWAWLPPPLVGQGRKVQTDWLHDFLLDPHAIRPAVLLRMPKFNMSPEEATKIVNYFAAVDNVQFPYEFTGRRRSAHLDQADQQYRQRLREEGLPETSRFDAAMTMITNKDGCVACHRVGDYEKPGSDRAKAPDLSQVYKRLRPGYMRRWIARPVQLLPYTAMPENIKYDPNAPHLGGVRQELFHGTSVQQVDALVDLLMNFDEYSVDRNSVSDLVPAGGATDAAAGGESNGGESSTE